MQQNNVWFVPETATNVSVIIQTIFFMNATVIFSAVIVVLQLKIDTQCHLMVQNKSLRKSKPVAKNKTLWLLIW